MADSQVIERFFPSDARLLRTEKLDSKAHGTQQEWTEAGVLIFEAHYRHGELHGAYRSWWDDGIAKEVGEYISGKRHGTHRWYTPSGELWSAHTFLT